MKLKFCVLRGKKKYSRYVRLPLEYNSKDYKLRLKESAIYDFITSLPIPHLRNCFDLVSKSPWFYVRPQQFFFSVINETLVKFLFLFICDTKHVFIPRSQLVSMLRWETRKSFVFHPMESKLPRFGMSDKSYLSLSEIEGVIN